MRINSNKKIHKMKRDPYKTLLKTSGILAIVVVVGIGVYWLCSTLVVNEYKAMKVETEKQNIEGEQEFNARMNELRSSNSRAATSTGAEASQGELSYWEKTLGEDLWRVEDEGYTGLENTNTQTLDRSLLLTGGLLLVNPWHPLPNDFSDAELKGVGIESGYKIQVQDNTVKLFPEAYNALSAMLTDAGNENLTDFMVWEAYRTNDKQTENFNTRMEKLSKDYSGDILIEQTKKYVNYPGTSEFQTGFSFNLGLYNKSDPEVRNQKFYETAQGKWVLENCWKYGFVFRFPMADYPTSEWEDKSYKTGISTPLSVFRYVGRAHAAAMRTLDYCLEEYIEFLEAHPHICIYQDGGLKYEIFRISAAEVQSTYDVPVTNPAIDFQASLDNMGGLVMAYTYQ